MSIEGSDPELIASIIAGVRAELADRRDGKRKAASERPVDEVQMLRAQARELRAQAARMLDAAWRAEQRLRLLEELGCKSESVDTERASARADGPTTTLGEEGAPRRKEAARSSAQQGQGPVGAKHS